MRCQHRYLYARATQQQIRPLSAHLTRCQPVRLGSAYPTDTGRSASAVGLSQNVPEPVIRSPSTATPRSASLVVATSLGCPLPQKTTKDLTTTFSRQQAPAGAVGSTQAVWKDQRDGAVAARVPCAALLPSPSKRNGSTSNSRRCISVILGSAQRATHHRTT